MTIYIYRRASYKNILVMVMKIKWNPSAFIAWNIIAHATMSYTLVKSNFMKTTSWLFIFTHTIVSCVSNTLSNMNMSGDDFHNTGCTLLGNAFAYTL